MNKFVIATLAATFLVPAGAAAQSGHGSAQARPGVSWQHGGGKHAMPRHGGNRMMPRHHGNRQVFVQRRGGKHMMPGKHFKPGRHMKPGRHQFVRRHHGGNRFFHHKRIDRGFMVPHFWWGPRFHIQNWGLYGFSAPSDGQRWIRYYDDALLIDREGRVQDGRWGMRWDEHADQWAYDDRGIPYYDEDYADEDYASDEGYEDVYAGHDGPPPPPPPPPCPQACAAPMPGYGHGYSHVYPGYGYGYGWMPGGMITVTETTVHAAAPQTVTKTVYVHKKVKTKPRRSYKRAKPRPLPGERG